VANESEVQVTLIEQRLFAKADKTTKHVIQMLLSDIRNAVNLNGRYHKVTTGTLRVGYMVVVDLSTDKEQFREMEVGELLNALEQSLFLAWRDKFRNEEIDAFVARVENSK
jgi:hypothetical protein